MHDTHCHLNFADFNKDREEVIKRTLDGGVFFINVGVGYKSSKAAVEIAEQYPDGVYAAIGLHPENALGEKFISKKYKKLAKSKKVVAIGEIGLDYWHLPREKEKLDKIKTFQKEILLKQLNIAGELGLPVIFHCRKAHNELINILESQKRKIKISGVIHCFTGNQKQAKKYLEMGFYLGFNGMIFKLDLGNIIKKTPLDRILTETDSPLLVPPQEHCKRNEPLFVKDIIERIAELKKLPFKQISEESAKNAEKLFHLPKKA